MKLDEMHPDSMAKFIGTSFDIVDGQNPGLSLKLAEIVTHTAAENLETFSLIFHGPLEFFLPQGIRKLNHKEIGEIDLFLVPVGKDMDGYKYEAVFNRMV